jgi:hypothetical protein
MQRHLGTKLSAPSLYAGCGIRPAHDVLYAEDMSISLLDYAGQHSPYPSNSIAERPLSYRGLLTAQCFCGQARMAAIYAVFTHFVAPPDNAAAQPRQSDACLELRDQGFALKLSIHTAGLAFDDDERTLESAQGAVVWNRWLRRI